MSENNPMSHVIGHLQFAPREAIMQEIVRVWSENQEMVRFESFSTRLSHLNRLHSQADFMLGVTELVLWFGREMPYEKSVPHTVSPEILESYLIHSTSAMLRALTDLNATWTVGIQADRARMQISDPKLGWKGQIVPWEKVAKSVEFLEKKRPWKSALYIKVLGEPYQVMWIDQNTNTVSICTLLGGCRVENISTLINLHKTQQTHPVYCPV